MHCISSKLVEGTACNLHPDCTAQYCFALSLECSEQGVTGNIAVGWLDYCCIMVTCPSSVTDLDCAEQDFWGKMQWWWERPPLKRVRTTVSMAQWSVKLPALMALVATQVGLLASQVQPTFSCSPWSTAPAANRTMSPAKVATFNSQHQHASCV